MLKDQVKPFATGHDDLIHDIEYDFYGRQLATCSSDQHIKVFDLNPATSSWTLNDSWKAHDSSIVKVAYASPEFGHILVSISYDRTVKIWEENFDEQLGSGRRWKRLTTIADSHGPLYDVAFAPSYLGLRLGTIGSDGILRIYDAIEPSDLRHWTLISEIPVLNSPAVSHLQSDFSLSWCPSRFSGEKLIVSALDQAYIYLKDQMDKYVLGVVLPEHDGLIRSVSWAPSMGRSYHLIATGCKDGLLRIFKLTEELPSIESETNDSSRGSKKQSQLDNAGDLDDDAVMAGIENSQSKPISKLKIELLSKNNDHKGEVWKVCWNLTGTILSSAGDDGKVRLWKASYNNIFQCMSVITAEEEKLHNKIYSS